MASIDIRDDEEEAIDEVVFSDYKYVCLEEEEFYLAERAGVYASRFKYKDLSNLIKALQKVQELRGE